MAEYDAGLHATSERPPHHRDIVAAESGRRYPDEHIARPDDRVVSLAHGQHRRVSGRLQYQGPHAPSIGGRLGVDKDRPRSEKRSG